MRDARRLPGGQPDLTVPSSGGVTLAVHDLGGEGPPLLLGHATGFHGRVWGPCAAHLPYRAWAPDLRGHGASPLPPEAFGPTGEPDGQLLVWDRFADDVLAVVDALGADGPLAAAGHSKGGAALLLAEQRRPGTFRALYLYEPVVFPAGLLEVNPLADGARRRRRRFGSFGAARANYGAKPPLDTLDPDALDAYVRFGFVEQPDGSVELACAPEVEAVVFDQGLRHGAFSRLGEVSCPVTVAVGSETPGPAQFGPLVVDALPRGELVRHPDLGHLGPLEAPAVVAADLAAHLAP